MGPAALCELLRNQSENAVSLVSIMDGCEVASRNRTWLKRQRASVQRRLKQPSRNFQPHVLLPSVNCQDHRTS